MSSAQRIVQVRMEEVAEASRDHGSNLLARQFEGTLTAQIWAADDVAAWRLLVWDFNQCRSVPLDCAVSWLLLFLSLAFS
jgi:hypothetical protein